MWDRDCGFRDGRRVRVGEDVGRLVSGARGRMGGRLQYMLGGSVE